MSKLSYVKYEVQSNLEELFKPLQFIKTLSLAGLREGL